ncbi:unnamed protein product [Chrysodeixis includens]|uniref:Uncharacterized protein n=1 Tax=Chrysodeixis includens TaxID=689277 RepID=A0A9N8L429_CHRIL|nr:unnamed protein product [Chrysodeixis includens]
MLSSASNLTTTELPQVPLEVSNEVEVEGEGFAWSAWGSWGPCSRTCGGGVSMQERQCLPRTRSNVSDNSIAQKPVISVRVTRQTREPDCPGVDRRYHECNNAVRYLL